MNEIYIGRGSKADEKQLIEVLDDVFFSDDRSTPKCNFMDLLPKLYKDKYNPGYNNLIVKEGEEIKAAVGCYPLHAVAAGRPLKILGIGNVAVAKDSRRKGYMIKLMNMALEMMKEEDYDYSLLGGQRQRYGYFGYEPTGGCCRFTINRGNVDRLLGKDAKTTLTVREITPADTDIIKKLKTINDSMPFHILRAEDDYIDILKSWNCTPYAAFDGEEFAGYFAVHREGHIHEIKAEKTEQLLNLIMCLIDFTGKESISFTAPVFDTEVCDYMIKICCDVSIGNVEMINIFNYGKFIEAFLAVKAGRVNLCSGTLTLLIHGSKRDENLSITVDGKNVTVCETDANPDIELDNLEAVDFLSGLYSKKRNSLPAFAQGWFPLDFYSGAQDNV